MQNDPKAVVHPHAEVEVTSQVLGELELIGGGQAVINTV